MKRKVFSSLLSFLVINSFCKKPIYSLLAWLIRHRYKPWSKYKTETTFNRVLIESSTWLLSVMLQSLRWFIRKAQLLCPFGFTDEYCNRLVCVAGGYYTTYKEVKRTGKTSTGLGSICSGKQRFEGLVFWSKSLCLFIHRAQQLCTFGFAWVLSDN